MKVLLRRWDWTPCGSPRHLSSPNYKAKNKLQSGNNLHAIMCSKSTPIVVSKRAIESTIFCEFEGLSWWPKVSTNWGLCEAANTSWNGFELAPNDHNIVAKKNTIKQYTKTMPRQMLVLNTHAKKIKAQTLQIWWREG